MKNKFKDLNDHLFCQLERLSDEGLSDEKLKAEVLRSNAIVSVSNKIVAAAALQLRAVQLVAQHGNRVKPPAGLIEHIPEPPQK